MEPFRFCMWHPLPVYYISRDHANAHELTNHILLATIAGSRLAFARSARNDVAQVEWNGSCIADGDNRKLSKDVLNGDYIKNRFPVVKLVYNSRSN
jgi:hypothetical protein